MSKKHLIDCPFCHGSMEVDADSGKISQKWEPSQKKLSTNEKFTDAIQKMKEGKDKRDAFFSSAAEEMEKKKKKADDLFNEQLGKIKKDGKVEKPHNPLDFE